MTDRTAARTAGGLWLVGLGLSVAAAVLQFLTRDVPVAYYGIRGFQGVFGLVIGGVGALIAARRRANPIGWILLGAGVVSTLQAFGSAYGTYSIARQGGTLPLTTMFVWFGVWIWMLIVGPMSTYVLILFPEGRFEKPAHRRLAIFSTIAMAALAVIIGITPGQAGELPVGIENPFAVSKDLADKLAPLMGLFVLAVAGSIGVLIGRFRRATGELRQQMKWLTFAGSIAVVSIVINLAQIGTSGNLQDTLTRVAAIAVIIGFGGIPVAAGVAILRFGLYEIDVLINKTIVYSLLALFIGGIYVFVVAVVGAFASFATGDFAIVVAALAALAIHPLRVRATRLANRLVFGKRATPYEALSEFSARLSEGVATEDTLPRLARLMTEATAADRASVWLAVGAEMRPAGAFPTDIRLEPEPAGDTIAGWDRVYPVRHEGELLGALAVSAPPNDPLKASEERLLSDLAAQAGLLLRNARLIEELRASRQRLVAAQDEERRKIERNLHDGAQQQLVALAVNLKLAGSIMERDPVQAKQMLEQLRTDATDAVENLRALAHGIYPPLLAERGLVTALQSQAAKTPLPVTVDGDGVGRYPQEVESAVYFCVLEALQNVSKYAQASRATVLVRGDDGTLRFEVADDGAGFDPRMAKRGAGLTNMTDRLEAIGGTLTVHSEPGEGTRVIGTIASDPLA